MNLNFLMVSGEKQNYFKTQISRIFTTSSLYLDYKFVIIRDPRPKVEQAKQIHIVYFLSVS